VIYPGNDRGSDGVVHPFTKYLLTNCEAFESDVDLHDTACATSSELAGNTFHFLNRKKRILVPIVIFFSTSFYKAPIIYII
jgi:hypothetical protein